MRTWSIWYKDELLGYIAFSANVEEHEMFNFAKKLGIRVSFFMEA